MLIGFNVGNFLTFEGIERFTMVSDGSDEHRDHVIQNHKTDLLHGSFIYGPNASGKSNFVKAIKYSKNIIVNGFDKCEQIASSKNYSNRNEYGNNNDRPSYFEYILDIDGKHYSYGFEIKTKDNICTSEWLYELGPNNDEKMIFTMDMINDKANDKSTLSIINNEINSYRNTNQHILFIKYLFENNTTYESIITIFRWFESQLVIRTSEQKEQIIISDNQFLNKLSFYLERFDTGINGYELKRITSYCDEYTYYLSDEQNNIVTKRNELNYILYNEKSLDNGSFTYRSKYPNEDASYSKKTIELCKKACKNNGNCILFSNNAMILVSSDNNDLVFSEIIFHHGENKFKINYHDESQGTRRLVDIISNLLMITEVNSEKDIINPKETRTIIIDELECSIHTLATIELVKLYYKIANNKEMQMVATTHESKLLTLDLIRKDEIWFISIDDTKRRHSSMYSLTQFKDLSKKFICYGYLNGDFGAIPAVKQSLKGDD